MSDAKDWLFRVDDVLECISQIEIITAKISEDEFYGDMIKFRAAERNFEIIAEASKNLPDLIKSEYPDVPWKDIVGMRNIIAHQYGSVDETFVWHAAKNSLTPLKDVMLQIKKKYGK